VAWSLGNGLVAWAEEHPALAEVGQVIAVSCGFVRSGVIPAFYGLGFTESCDEMLDERLPEALATLRPDVVMVMSTRADVEARIWDPGDDPIASTEPESLERRIAEYSAFTDQLLFRGAPVVVWVQPPVVRSGELPDQPMMDPAAIDALGEAIEAVVAGRGPRVRSLDLAGWLAASGIDDTTARPDGLHFQPEPATEVADRMLAPALITAALSVG
jgi:hypothetical protein